MVSEPFTRVARPGMIRNSRGRASEDKKERRELIPPMVDPMHSPQSSGALLLTR